MPSPQTANAQQANVIVAAIRDQNIRPNGRKWFRLNKQPGWFERGISVSITIAAETLADAFIEMTSRAAERQTRSDPTVTRATPA